MSKDSDKHKKLDYIKNTVKTRATNLIREMSWKDMEAMQDKFIEWVYQYKDDYDVINSIYSGIFTAFEAYPLNLIADKERVHYLFEQQETAYKIYFLEDNLLDAVHKYFWDEVLQYENKTDNKHSLIKLSLINLNNLKVLKNHGHVITISTQANNT